MLLEKISKKYAANIGISVFAAFICCQTREKFFTIEKTSVSAP
jgi:hypothetical protein